MRAHVFGMISLAACMTLVIPLAQADVTVPVSNQAGDLAALGNEQLIVAVLYRKQQPLSDGMFAYAINGEMALPLEQFAFMVEFAIQEQAGGRKASGWFISENRRFSLDLDAGKVVSDGKTYSLNASQVKLADGQLYVPTSLLAKWFPLRIQDSLRALEVTISPLEATAIDERLNRQNRQFGKTYRAFASNPEQQTPYSAISIPAVSANISVGYHSVNDQPLYNNYSLRAEGDLAYMHSKLTLFGNEQELTDARFSLSRRNSRGGLLGKLDATEIELGDISTRSAPLVSGSVGGRGVHISRKPANYVGDLEKVTLEDIVEPGYDVELYRNNILINALRAASSGRYSFKNIELFGGQNELRLEFYGPQGQRRTKTERYFIGAGQLKKGELNYDIAASQRGKTTLGVSSDDKTYADDALAASIRVGYGVTSRLSINAGVAQSPLASSDETLYYGFAGVHTMLKGVYANLDTAFDDKGGSAYSLNATTRVGNNNFSARYQHYLNNFKSNTTAVEDSGKQVVRHGSVSADTYTSDWIKGASFNVGLQASQTQYDDGDNLSELDLRASAQVKYLAVTTNLQHDKFSQTGNKTTQGDIQANLNLFNTQFHAKANFDISPDRRLKSHNFGISRALRADYKASMDYYREHETDTRTLSVSLNKEYKFASVGLIAAQHDESGKPTDNSLFLTFGFNSFTDSARGKTDFASKTAIRSAARITTFIDDNLDGMLNPSERTLPDVNVRGFSRAMAKTDSNGQALLYKSARGDWIDISLDAGSMPEPNLKPANNGVAVLPRGGKLAEIHMPVIRTADVEGVVSLSKNGGEPIPLGNIEIQAVQTNPSTRKQTVVATAMTAMDGFYSLAGTPMGQTRLRIEPAQVKRLAIAGNTQVDVLLGVGDKGLTQQDFLLTRGQ